MGTPEESRDAPDPWGPWLDLSAQSGEELTLGLPGGEEGTEDGAVAWMGRRAVWWPTGLPTGHSVSVASSRLGRRPDQQPTWFAALRTVAARCQTERGYLLSVANTTSSEFVAHAAELFGTNLLQVHVTQDDKPSPAMWLNAVRQFASELETTQGILHAFVSPPMANDPTRPAHQTANRLNAYPQADRILLAMSDQVYVPKLRPHGNLAELLQHALSNPPRPTCRIHLLADDLLVPPKLRERLMSHGALGWYLMSRRDTEAPGSGDDPVRGEIATGDSRSRAPAARVLTRIPRELNAHFLVHCTRRRHGPWPNETRSEYLEQLVNDQSAADHSPLSALKRIATERRLAATGTGIRGGAEMVSFTAVPLPDIHRLRVFRSHRGRWDFEPYGVAIRRQWLVDRGTRPVRYADPNRWSELEAKERPFYQRTRSVTASGRTIDWTVEQEWRHPGDLGFEDLAVDDAFLFVPTQSEAQQLATVSRWPVIAMEPS